jgi:hypothetical protein
MPAWVKVIQIIGGLISLGLFAKLMLKLYKGN